MVKQTMVHLTPEQIARADEEASRQGVSRSALIRAALDAYLSTGRAATLDRLMREGYDRVPQAGSDEWGDLGELVDHGTRESLARLAVEERTSGSDTW